MELSDWLAEKRGRASALAEGLGVSSSFVSQIANSEREPPAERCAEVERLTGYAVRRWDMRKRDWHKVWPELVGLADAPPIPAAEAA